MNVVFEDGWDDRGYHDSSYSEAEVKTLVQNVAYLPGIANTNAMPLQIADFVTLCVLGNQVVRVTKGIHERWDSINASGVVKKWASPHVQVAYDFTFPGGKHSTTRYIHVQLSEEIFDYKTLRSGEKVAECNWQTVGISAVHHNNIINFPAYFVQNVDNIQSQEPGRNGRKRRFSIGLIVPGDALVA